MTVEGVPQGSMFGPQAVFFRSEYLCTRLCEPGYSVSAQQIGDNHKRLENSVMSLETLVS